jgi:hypothetical protein
VGATILAVLLPARVDSAAGERTAQLGGTTTARVPVVVVRALRCNAGLRLLSGFLTLYMAFLLRAEPFPAFEGREALLLALVIGAAGLGSTVGIALGTLLKSLRAEVVVVMALVAGAAAAVVAAVLYSLPVVLLLGLTAGVAQSIGKLSLDALIQGRVPEGTRSSAFARSETLLQLSWVVGGFLGIALPLVPSVGLGVAAAVLVGLAAWVLNGVRREGALGLAD